MSITGQRLKELRKKMGLSADDISTSLGVSRSTIFRYENGKIEKVPSNILEKLAKILRTTPAYLMGWTDDSEDWERIANEEGICPPNDYDGDPEDWYRMKIATDEDHPTDEELHYYINEETREIAQEVFENPDLRSLFHVARDIDPEELRAHIDFMKRLKAKEKKNDDNEGC